MDSREAKLVADSELERLRSWPFAELVRFTRREETPLKEVSGPSGKKYYVETVAQWDDPSQKRLRVSVLVDNGGLRSFFPLACDMVVSQ